MDDARVNLELFFTVSAGLLGLIVGSFANVVIHRVPLDESIAFPASRCPACRTPIRAWQNVPVVSWLLLGGRCASCRVPISSRYPLVEALHGAGFAALMARFGPTPFTPVLFLLFFALVVLALIDWDHQILPDVITLPGILVGLATTLVPGALVGWRDAALAAAAGYLSFFVVAEGYARLRNIEGLGMGDWKLAAMMGAFLGLRRLLLVVFLASVSGMVYGLFQAFRLRARGERVSPLPEPEERALEAKSGDSSSSLSSPTESNDPVEEARPDDAAPPDSIGRYKLPFGTFLAGAAILVLFAGDEILFWYGGLFLP